MAAYHWRLGLLGTTFAFFRSPLSTSYYSYVMGYEKMWTEELFIVKDALLCNTSKVTPIGLSSLLLLVGTGTILHLCNFLDKEP